MSKDNNRDIEYDFDEKDVKDQSVFDEFDEDINPSIHDIVVALINDSRNIRLKTEIHNVRAITFLYSFKKYVKDKGYNIYSSFLKYQLKINLESNVSVDRKSRKEVRDILSSWYEREFISNKGQSEVKSIE